jgi:hypothetical protein
MIPVIWYGLLAGQEHKNCTVMLREMLSTYDCQHDYLDIPDGLEGAVVVVHGESCFNKILRLNASLAKLKWVIVVLLGDETHMVNPEFIRHENKRLWLQEPVPRVYEADRYILDGWTFGCKRADVPKDLSLFFGGQDTHLRRKECVNALRDQFDWDVVMVLSKGYTLGVGREEYFRMMSRAKFVPCPCGPSSPDSARPWEALQCGAIPILDSRGGYEGLHEVTGGFWSLVLGDHPLPVVTDWSAFPHQFKTEWLPNYEVLRDKCLTWWEGYLADWNTWLEKDIQCLTKT